jgi:DNA-binding protein HU-beta
VAEKTLNRSELLRTVAERTGMARKEVEQVYEHTIRTIQEAVKQGRKVALSGFGRFSQRVRAARKAGIGRNPFTGETIQLPARPEMRIPRFTPAKQFKEFVSGQIRSLPPLPKAKPKPKAAKAPARRATARAGGRGGTKRTPARRRR